jgi:hypothetical protein
MATDALSIPHDIPWKRVAFSRDMFDPRRGGSLPPKWRSSLTVYAYAIPLADTAEDYPDSRIVYFKLSASITGWAESEALNDGTVLNPDQWVADAWDAVHTAAQVSEYWGCICAFAQLAIFPRPEAGVPIDDYPYVMDFEPKKRELYEAVTASGETLSGTAAKLSTGKSHTSASATEESVAVSASAFGFGVDVSHQNQSSTQDVNTTSADRSTERRETQGRTAQFSQMYQLFNGYHLGTNRALFVVFPRPHTTGERTDAAGNPTRPLANNLINGERKLEGIQEMFLVVHFPATMTGFCLDAWLDTGHKVDLGPSPLGTMDSNTPVVVTRRYITGCAQFNGDRISPIIDATPPRIPDVVGEFGVNPEARFAGMRPGEFARSAPTRAVEASDHLNLLAAETRRQAMAFQMNENYTARPYKGTSAFQTRVLPALQTTRVELDDLESLGHITKTEHTNMTSAGVHHSGEIFAEPKVGTWPQVVYDVRARLIAALVNAIK